jgi:hypothetical protein
MRKEKASDKRERRRRQQQQQQQHHGETKGAAPDARRYAMVGRAEGTVTRSPMSALGSWKRKAIERPASTTTASADVSVKKMSGRGRSRKRSSLYVSLAYYQNQFLDLLTTEYKAEVRAIELG